MGTEFNPNLFTADTHSRVLKRVANSADGIANPAHAVAVGVAKPTGTQHSALIINATKGSPFEKGYRPTPGYDTDSGKDHVDAKPIKDSKDRPNEDRVKEVAMPNPKSTIYRLLFEQDDHGQYLSDAKGSQHFRMTPITDGTRASDAFMDTGVKPELSDNNEDDPSTHLCRIAEAADSAIEATDADTRDHFIKKICEHLEATAKAVRAKKHVRAEHSFKAPYRCSECGYRSMKELASCPAPNCTRGFY
jgi:hypothetical protein